jgi:hypothetical protein
MALEQSDRRAQANARRAASMARCIAAAGSTQSIAVADSKQRGIELAKDDRCLQRGRLVPRGHGREGEQQAQDTRYSHAAAGLERVAGDEAAVAHVEKGDMAGRVAGRRHHLQRADSIYCAFRRIRPAIPMNPATPWSEVA